jgi:hypothetical protein
MQPNLGFICQAIIKVKIFFMKNYLGALFIFILITALFQSCKKDNGSTTNCFPNDITSRQITDKQAMIKSTNGHFYIIEQNTIDTKLNPCNLAKEFQVDNLLVKISGDVKATAQGGPGPCCIENFVITQITR